MIGQGALATCVWAAHQYRSDVRRCWYERPVLLPWGLSSRLRQSALGKRDRPLAGDESTHAAGQEWKFTKVRSKVDSHRRHDYRMPHSRLRIDGWAINLKRTTGPTARRA